MNYIEISVKVEENLKDILIAELAQIGYDTFTESDEGFEGYIPEDAYEEATTKQIIDHYRQLAAIDYSTLSIAQQNWNEEWEKNFEPVVIANTCVVRATFHAEQPQYPHEIIINPKMSFGTGHHSTTALVIEQQLHIDHVNKSVLDAGSGTGILAIMAEKLGASRVTAFDIDEWPVENAKENVGLNHCSNIHVFQGQIYDLQVGDSYDIILANINRNILLEQIPAYAQHLVPVSGILVVSGFYENDITDIDAVAAGVGLKLKHFATQNNWATVVFVFNDAIV